MQVRRCSDSCAWPRQVIVDHPSVLERLLAMGARKAKGVSAFVTPAKKPRVGESAASPAGSVAPSPVGQAPGLSFGRNQAAALSVLAPTAHPSQFFVNASHWSEVEVAMQLILDHPVFNGITQEVPLPFDQSGITPFSTTDFDVAMSAGMTYTCGANAFWASVFFMTSPGVPINRNGVRALVLATASVPLFATSLGVCCHHQSPSAIGR